MIVFHLSTIFRKSHRPIFRSTMLQQIHKTLTHIHSQYRWVSHTLGSACISVVHNKFFFPLQLESWQLLCSRVNLLANDLNRSDGTVSGCGTGSFCTDDIFLYGNIDQLVVLMVLIKISLHFHCSYILIFLGQEPR